MQNDGTKLIKANLADAGELRVFLDGSRRRAAPLHSCTVGLGTYEPGWRWSLHAGAQTGKASRGHIGYIISGRFVVRDADGNETEVGPGDAFEVGPGHDAWVVGDTPCVSVDFFPFAPSSTGL